MTLKKIINKNVEIIIPRLFIILCIITLVNFIFKRNIVIQNQRINEINDFINSNKNLKIILDFIICIMTASFISLICIKERRHDFKNVIIFSIVSSICFCLSKINVILGIFAFFLLIGIITYIMTKNAKKWVFLTLIINIMT